jgi:hypothetical protein
VYNNQNHWVSGLSPSSWILYNYETQRLETGSVSIFRRHVLSLLGHHQAIIMWICYLLLDCLQTWIQISNYFKLFHRLYIIILIVKLRYYETAVSKDEAVLHTVNKNGIDLFITELLCDWPPLWSSGQGSWLQIRRPTFDSRHYQIFWGKKKKKTVVGLEWGPLSLVSTTEELLDRKVAAPV